VIEHVTVEHKSQDGLIMWKWRFYYEGQTLWLDHYATLERKTRRHSFVATEVYSRFDKRASTISETDLVLPSTVKEEAIKQFCQSISVKRWSERR
jgi:hypothetical protein